MMIEFYRTDRSVIAPVRSNPSDAGLDVYAFLEEPIEIAWGESAIIPTGLKFGIPHGFMIEVKKSSSTFTISVAQHKNFSTVTRSHNL